MVIVAESSVRTLSRLKLHYRGRNGERGSGGYRVGASGKTTIIKVYTCIYVFTVQTTAAVIGLAQE